MSNPTPAKGENENITTFKGDVKAFNETMKSKQGLVVVTFWGQWCGPCRRLTGMLPQVASDSKDVSFIKIDVDDNPELALHFNIIGIPYVILFKGMDGNEPKKVAEILGLDNAELRKAISANK